MIQNDYRSVTSINFSESYSKFWYDFGKFFGEMLKFVEIDSSSSSPPKQVEFSNLPGVCSVLQIFWGSIIFFYKDKNRSNAIPKDLSVPVKSKHCQKIFDLFPIAYLFFLPMLHKCVKWQISLSKSSLSSFKQAK